jgi:Tol biopolymer transport system component
LKLNEFLLCKADGAGLRQWLLLLGALALIWQLLPPEARAEAQADHASIFTVNVDGSDARPLIAVEGMVWHGSPAYSPDGERIAFDAAPEAFGGPATRLYIVALKDQRKTITDLGFGSNPTWLPEGKRIAFFLHQGNAGGDKPGVYSMNSDGSDRKWLSEGEKPRWAPVGDKLLLMSRHEGFPSIYVIEEGKRRRILFEKYNNISSGSWSPDGKKIVYIGMRNNKTELGITATGGEEEPVKVRWQGRIGWIPSWSPDGKQIALWVKNERGQQRLALISPIGEDPPVEIKGQEFTSFNSDPAWSPDGKRIAFTSDRAKP